MEIQTPLITPQGLTTIKELPEQCQYWSDTDRRNDAADSILKDSAIACSVRLS